ncbi:MAG: GNAT family N-acetyltransferase, partial [Bacteroidales bacterium]
MTDSDISQLKALWQDVFGDTPEYINLVFHESHADDIFTVSRGGQILSMGFLQAYTLKYHDRLLPAGYFYGAATRPGERGKGHMARILQNVISEAERRHYAALILIPADGGLYDYYSRIGFKTAFYAGFQSYAAIPDFSVPARQKIVKIEDNLFFYSFFLEQELLRPVTLLHTLEQFRK